MSDRLKILVVDDEERIRDLIRNWLEMEGFIVFEAENGKKAIELQRKNPVDLMICDLIMPVQEGIETITQFKNEFPDICIIAISGGGKIGPDSYLTVAEHLGAWKVYTKPVDMKRLIDAIREWDTSNKNR